MAEKQQKEIQNLESENLENLTDLVNKAPTPNLPKAPDSFVDPNVTEAQKLAMFAPDIANMPAQKYPNVQNGFLQNEEKLLGTAQVAPSLQQDIDKVLSGYMDQLTNLGPEYGAEMEFLKPYLSADQPTGLAPAPAYTGPDASVVNANNEKLTQAEQGLGTAAQNLPGPGFGNAADYTKGYEQSLLYGQPIQAMLGYQKYLETYGGLAASKTGLPSDIAAIYGALSAGGSSGPGGLPTAGQAAAGANANSLFSATQNQPAAPVSH